MSDRWDDEEALVWIDHREEEDALLRAFAERLPADDGLVPFWRDDQLWLRWRGAEHRIPLTFSAVDRYVALHSLATLLTPDYRLLVQRDSLESDTHGLLLMPEAEWQGLDAAARARLDAGFAPLEPGIDGFSGLRVPYLGHEDEGADAAEQRRAMSARSDAYVDDLMKSPQMQHAMRDFRRDMAALAAPRRPFWRRHGRTLLLALGLFILLRLLRG